VVYIALSRKPITCHLRSHSECYLQTSTGERTPP